MGRLAGKRTLITGAGSGLGRESAVRFAEEGALVACCDIVGASAESIAAELTAAGHLAIAITANVSEEADSTRMVHEAVAAFGGLDVVFANAGIAGAGRAGDTSIEAWDRVILVNLTGVWLSCRAGLRQFAAQGDGGTLIVTASVGGMIGVPGIAAYTAAKAGVIGLVRQIAVDYGPEGVRINAICPGTVPTPLVRQTYAEGGGFATGRMGTIEDTFAASLANFPLGRLGRERDVADAAVYLASDESSWITGTSLVVDGGMTAR